MGSRILGAVVFGFLTGVATRSFVPVGYTFAIWMIFLSAGALSLLYFSGVKRNSSVLAAIFLLALALGIGRMHSAIVKGDPYLSSHIGEKITLVGTVADEPDERESGVRVALNARFASTTPVSAGVLVLLPPHTDISYGDTVKVSGKLRIPESFDTTLGRTFDYPAYLAKDGIGYELAFAHLDAVEGQGGDPIKTSAVNTKKMYLRGLDAAIAEPEAGLAAGITVGDKRGLGPELSNTFRAAGLVHVVVLSGYNITLVIKFVKILLSRTPRIIETGGIFGSVLFFIIMSGTGASAVRAGAMALIAIYASRSGRVFDAPRVLGAVAVAMVLWNPFILAFDPSFQLSALATLGLVLFSPIFAAHFRWVTEKYSLREILSSTLGTQLTVLPLLLYQNGQLSLVSLPVNLLALIAVPPAMLLSFVASIAGMFAPTVAVFIGAPAYALLWYIIEVAKFFTALPFASLSLPAFPAWVMFAAYALIFGSYMYIKRGGPESLPAR